MNRIPLKAKVKIINPKHSGGNTVEEWEIDEKFDTFTSLRSEIGKAFSEFIVSDFDFGYMQPGHGMKGKQFIVSTDSDITAMYKEFKNKKCILLWIKCLSRPRKRSNESADNCPDPKRSTSNYGAVVEKMHEVDVIVKDLESRHKGKWTTEQIRCWANMIQMKDWHSYENPPNKPFFKTKSTHPSGSGVSLGKKVTLRSQCIQQLDKWHDLSIRGVISDEQYKEFKDTILADMKKFD